MTSLLSQWFRICCRALLQRREKPHLASGCTDSKLTSSLLLVVSPNNTIVLGWSLIRMASESEKGGDVKMSVSSIQQAHSAMLGHALRGQIRSKNMFLQTIFFCVNIIIRFLDLWEISKAKLDETSSDIQISPSPCSPREIVPEK